MRKAGWDLHALRMALMPLEICVEGFLIFQKICQTILRQKSSLRSHHHLIGSTKNAKILWISSAAVVFLVSSTFLLKIPLFPTLRSSAILCLLLIRIWIDRVNLMKEIFKVLFLPIHTKHTCLVMYTTLKFSLKDVPLKFANEVPELHIANKYLNSFKGNISSKSFSCWCLEKRHSFEEFLHRMHSVWSNIVNLSLSLLEKGFFPCWISFFSELSICVEQWSLLLWKIWHFCVPLEAFSLI